ncbi:MAG TPA: CpsB/CapC family capsule biosynthesis tyrosine phosphatase, partial [Thermodesulfovibrionales bacterium]|nr:CpsB/CapC family capsule biosynthesis tyrosine phosphatase [Thermodesulfovibrionales bacterium]
MHFIDIHCHILPGLDDGPSNIEESSRMIEVAVKDSVSAIFATPHIIRGIFDNNSSKITASVERLKEHVPDNLKLFYGADVRITFDLLERVESREIPTLNGSGYMLVEMPEFIVPPLIENLIFNIRHKG